MDPFAARLLAWFDEHGRHDLPWQRNVTPYRVWVSEIMLQQTQVATVIPYYSRFMERFGDVAALASADLDEVLHYWSGLGYYARARNLHQAAQDVMARWDGRFPNQQADLETLPGIGRSTAAAILSLAFEQRAAILDGNVKRVLSRYHGVEGWSGQSRVLAELWRLAEGHTPNSRCAAYTQAIMDLGATVCTRKRPACTLCPMARDCVAACTGRQAEIPAPRPRRDRPTRRQAVVVARNAEGAVLLQRRPGNGVWGGLWSFPELDVEETAENWCRLRLKQTVLKARPLAPVHHAFTHFDLIMEPRCLEVESSTMIMDNRDWLWYKARDDDDRRVGIPAPVQNLLTQLLDQGRDS